MAAASRTNRAGEPQIFSSRRLRPAILPPSQHVPVAMVTDSPTAAPAPQTILVVDDSTDTVRFLTRLLRSKG